MQGPLASPSVCPWRCPPPLSLSVCSHPLHRRVSLSVPLSVCPCLRAPICAAPGKGGGGGLVCWGVNTPQATLPIGDQ